MILAGDVGGTNSRLALFRRDDETLRLVRQATYPSANFATFDAVVARFRAEGEFQADAACFAIAGPVVENRVQATNLPWDIDGRVISERFGVGQSYLINDLVANAHGLFALEPDDYLTISLGAEKDDDPFNGHPPGNAAIISAGTGLGEAGLFWDGSRYHPFASEGGHADFAARDDDEWALCKHLRKRFGRVSYERVLSGPGLLNIYQFLKESGRGDEPDWLAERMATGDAPAEISRAALENDEPICRRAMEMFLRIYGAEAGNLALKMMATGGMWLGGGIAAKLGDRLRHSAVFLEGFTSKGRLSPVVEACPVRVVINSHTALMGSALYPYWVTQDKTTRWHIEGL